MPQHFEELAHPAQNIHGWRRDNELVPTLPIHEQLAGLYEQTDELTKQLLLLGDRLSVVMRPLPPSDGPMPQENAPMSSVLCGQLREVRGRLRHMQLAIEDMHARLEL